MKYILYCVGYNRKKQKQLKCPRLEEQFKILWFINIMKYFEFIMKAQIHRHEEGNMEQIYDKINNRIQNSNTHTMFVALNNLCACRKQNVHVQVVMLK